MIAQVLSEGGGQRVPEAVPEAVEIPLRHLVVRGLRWGTGLPRQVLALHGWLDNAATFTTLGPRLANAGCELLAFDLPGHGWSDHKPPGEIYHLLDSLVIIDQVIDALGRERVSLLGHSLGGVLGLLYAAAAPQRLDRLIVLDALGPQADDPTSVPDNLGRALTRMRQPGGTKRVYATLDEAAVDRMKGFGGLSPEAARILVERNLSPCEGGWQWHTDARLRWPSLLRMSEEQVRACLRAVASPLLLVFGRQGFFADPAAWRGRLDCLPHARVESVDGPHHLHMDGDVAALARLIDRFFG